MSILDKKHILTINLDDSSIEYSNKIKFYNTDKNISNLYVKIKKTNNDGVSVDLTETDLAGLTLKLAAIKPKTNQFREITGVLTKELKEYTCAIYKFELSSEFTNQVGIVYAQFNLSDGLENGEDVTIDPFSYEIKASKLTGLNAEIESNPDLPVLKALIEEVKETAQTVNNIDNVNVSDTKTYSNKKIEEKFSGVSSQIKEKANLNSVFTMANMGQDVKEAMTGGSVAVVAEDMVLDVNIVNNQVTSIKTDFLKIHKNLFNNLTAKYGYYWKNENGKIVETASAGYSNNKKIKINKGETYSLTDFSQSFTFLGDEEGNYIESVKNIAVNKSFTAPCNGFLYWSIGRDITNEKTLMIVNDSKLPSTYKEYNVNYDIKLADIDMVKINNFVTENNVKKVNTITVGKLLVLNFTSIKDAVNSITDSNENNIYNIYIEDGIYEEYSILLPNYVNLIGKSGNREKCIIKGELPVTSNDDLISATSTIDLKENNILENLTITGRNLRYPIHSETNGVKKDWTQILNNCHVEHFGNKDVIDYRKANDLDYSGVWNNYYAWGEGASSGAYAEFNNCTFKSVTIAWYVHGVAGCEKPYTHVLNNCELISLGKTLNYSIYISNSNDDLTMNNIFINNCYMNGKISKIGAYPINVKLSGCTQVPIIAELNEGDYPIYTENTTKYYADENLVKGDIVAFNEAFSIVKATNSTPKELIAGFVIGGGNAGDMLTVSKGYYKIDGAIGTMYKVENGALTSTTNKSDSIAISIGGFAKFI